MPRRICPELYPNPRPSAALLRLFTYLPLLVRLLAGLAAVSLVFLATVFLIAVLPVGTWLLITVAVVVPLFGGLSFVALARD